MSVWGREPAVARKFRDLEGSYCKGKCEKAEEGEREFEELQEAAGGRDGLEGVRGKGVENLGMWEGEGRRLGGVEREEDLGVWEGGERRVWEREVKRGAGGTPPRPRTQTQVPVALNLAGLGVFGLDPAFRGPPSQPQSVAGDGNLSRWNFWRELGLGDPSHTCFNSK